MKYIFKKKLKARYNTWSIWNYIEFCNPETDIEICDDLNVSIAELIKQGFVQEVKETTKPRWKVGDYVVTRVNEYIKISKVRLYNNEYFYDDCSEAAFRDPTPEELKVYFR